jgi:hypothetical protein
MRANYGIYLLWTTITDSYIRIILSIKLFEILSSNTTKFHPHLLFNSGGDGYHDKSELFAI